MSYIALITDGQLRRENTTALQWQIDLFSLLKSKTSIFVSQYLFIKHFNRSRKMLSNCRLDFIIAFQLLNEKKNSQVDIFISLAINYANKIFSSDFSFSHSFEYVIDTASFLSFCAYVCVCILTSDAFT